MPEPVELRVRGGERRGVPVAEADDGDPGEKVEVAPPVRVDDPRPLAGDDRHVLPRVGRQNRVRGDGVHATTAVAPISARTPSRAATTAARTFGTIPPASSPVSSRRSASPAASVCATAPSR